VSQNRRRIAVLDHHAALTDCLTLVLGIHHYEVTAVAVADGPDPASALVDHLRALGAEIVVLNVDAQQVHRLGLIAPVVRAGFPVVVLADGQDDAFHGLCLTRGARTAVPKSAPLADLVSVLRRVGRGQSVMEVGERERLIALASEQGRERLAIGARLGLLTPMEQAVLRELMMARTVTEIAELRGVAVSTVRAQVKSLLAKLEVTSQVCAVVAAHRAGWPASPEPAATTATRGEEPGRAAVPAAN
jgi:DNA-binding NarL/FixJ family response regulator